ncbi:hypothetical protein FSP39_024689 [Pinctada imbricata]|uniref:N-acetylgalactosaminide beta-1,3-galactosyltransferase n=1 Tax=Pinctada imbricata TaxID=66713 RepID=A0AA88YNZ0_PINIB|nr:hypothetical protein FSP39_024689 [Pinctada imbricata]
MTQEPRQHTDGNVYKNRGRTNTVRALPAVASSCMFSPEESERYSKRTGGRGPVFSKECNSSVGSANVHIQDDKSVRILCWIMVFSNNESNTDSVESTWGKRCDVLLFINSTIVPCLDGDNNQWRRSKKAFKYIYENHIMDADWFLKAENDTYVIIENLRYFLQNKSLTEPTYYGRRFKPYVSQDYMNGKAGFVINKMTLELLYRKGLDNSSICSSDEKEKYDIAVGKCLEHLGVIPGSFRKCSLIKEGKDLQQDYAVITVEHTHDSNK